MSIIIGSVLPLTEKNNGLLAVRCLGGMAEMKHTVLVLDGGEEALEKTAFEYDAAHGKCFSVLENNEKNLAKILRKADIMVFAATPPLQLLKKIAAEGIVPVIEKGAVAGLVEYEPLHETGNAFLFESADFWPFVTTLVRAIENSTFEYDWKRIKKNVKKWADA
jgi:hypothetical protein